MSNKTTQDTTPPLRGTPPWGEYICGAFVSGSYPIFLDNCSGNLDSPPLEGWQAQPDVVVMKRDTSAYMSLPYNPALKERARELRHAGNLSEVLLWQQIKNGQFSGLDFDRQKIIGNYIVDFYCAEKVVVIEVDGSSHDSKVEYDAARDAYLTGLDLTVIHVLDSEVKSNLAGVMQFLQEHPALITSPL